MNQQERLNYLVESFKEDSGEYRNLQVGDSERISDRRCKRERNRFP